METYLEIIKQIISEKAGVDAEIIKKESYFMDDLNIGEMDMEEIYDAIEEKLSVDVRSNEEYKEEFESMETVGNLSELVTEMLE